MLDLLQGRGDVRGRRQGSYLQVDLSALEQISQMLNWQTLGRLNNSAACLLDVHLSTNFNLRQFADDCSLEVSGYMLGENLASS